MLWAFSGTVFHRLASFVEGSPPEPDVGDARALARFSTLPPARLVERWRTVARGRHGVGATAHATLAR